MESVQPVYLVKGDDAGLLSQAVASLLGDLIGDRSPDMTLEEVPDDADVSAVLDAVQTPAFLTDRRVVVVRNAGRFVAADAEVLAGYLADPMPSTALVLIAGGGAIPARLAKAVKQSGHVLDASLPSGKARTNWVAEQLKSASVRPDREASALLSEHLGEELGQLQGILDALTAAYGEGATIRREELEPFLGAGGAAAPWELTDAIDRGDTETALLQLHRMLEGGRRHPLVIMATLQRHVTGLLRLDGAGAADESAAAKLLGMAPFPAKKLLTQARRLGSDKVGRAVMLLADADVHLRGASSWPPELVLEVLVARLSRLTPAGRTARR